MSTTSKLPFTSVVGYHMNPMTCGVAKFNTELARRLGVPFTCEDDYRLYGSFPVFSVKWSEFGYPAMGARIAARLRELRLPFGVFWHDAGDPSLTKDAAVVFYADPSLGSPGLWCPSLLTPSKPRTVRLFSFGMAHKLQTQHYAKVRQLLDAAGLDYHLRVSVGLHEGTSLSDATQHFEALKDIMGAEKVTILGILSDDAVSEELQNTDYVLAFFEQGLRANNTTVQAALDYWTPVVTNHDARTPALLCASTTDIRSGWLSPRYDWSWDCLIHEMETIYAKSHDRQPAHQR